MKKLFALIVMLGFATESFADDWRMRKFDLNADEYITKDELMKAGCNLKATTMFFKIADKNDDLKLGAREARRASDYLFRSNCPRNPKPINVRG